MFVLESFDNSSGDTTLYRAALPVLSGLGSSPTSIALSQTILPMFAMSGDLTVKTGMKRAVVYGEKPSNSRVEKPASIAELVLSPFESVSQTFSKIESMNNGSGLKDKPVRHHNVHGAGRVAFIGSPSGDVSIENWVPAGTYVIGGASYPTHRQEHRQNGVVLRSGIAGGLLGNVSGVYGPKRTYNGDFLTLSKPFGALIYTTAEGVNVMEGRNDSFGTPAGSKSYQHYGFNGVSCGPLSFRFTHETGNCYWGTTANGNGTETVHSDGYIRRHYLSGTATVLRKHSNPSYLVLQWTITSTRETLTLGPTGFALSLSVETETLTKVSYAIACSPLGAVRSSSSDSLTATGIAIGGVVRTIWRDLDSAPPSCHQIDAEKAALDDAVKLLSSNWIENATQTGKMMEDVVKSFAGLTDDFLTSALDNKPVKFLQESREIWKSLSALSGARKALVWSAKLYLLYRYVYKPTVKDVGEVIRVVDNWRDSKLRPESHVARGKVEGSSTFNGLTIRENRWAKLSFTSPITSDQVDLYSLGLAPTLANLWDLVPFSFVLDWVTNLNVLFDRIDFAVLNRNYHIKSNTAGRKLRTTIECNTHPLLAFIGVEGNMEVTSYSRDVLFSTSAISWSFSSRPTHQWASAGAALALVLFDEPITALQKSLAALNNFVLNKTV